MSFSSHGPEIYKQKDKTWFDDGREEHLLEYVRARLPSIPALPRDVINLVDEFGAKVGYLMNVGARKGHIVTEIITKRRPQVMIELGSYVGYSTVLFAAAVRESGGCEYISFERDPKFAKIAEGLVRLAGLSEIVRFVVGSSSSSLVAEHTAGRLSQVDIVFLDHYKPAYVRDVKICESLGLIKIDSVLVADNVIEPGNPTYLQYVRSTTGEKQALLSKETNSTCNGSFSVETLNQYKKEYGIDETNLPGVPSIVYESSLVCSYEPTGIPDGIEITWCRDTSN